jgi:serine/threonine-protein kinase
MATLGKYEIESELGHGGMGVVYRAFDPRLERLVALKTMHSSLAADPDVVKRFYREARAAGKLHHPNIVIIYDIGEAQGTPYIAMEFLEGQNLDQIIKSGKQIPLVQKCDYVVQVCRALHYAHSQGVIHRDIKPANIIAREDGLVKIVDFGIAQIGEGSITKSGVILGTPAYMSPERLRAAHGAQPDSRSDIFAVGAVLYELLTYQRAFPAEEIVAIVTQIQNESPEPVSSFISDCPAQLEKIVAKALEKDRDQRYQTAEEFALDLQSLADSVKHEMLDVYMKQAESSIQAGQLTLARESLRRLLEIDSGNLQARSRLQKVVREIEARKTAQRIDQAIRTAKEALQTEQYDKAISQLEEALALDPSHQSARQYLELARQRREEGRQIGEHMERAKRMAADVDFTGARAELEAVLALSPRHSGALRMMEWVLKEIAAKEIQRQVELHIRTARSLLEQQRFDQAAEELEKAGELDPINVEVEAVIAEVNSGRQQEEARRLRAERRAAVQAAMDRGDFQAATELADAMLAEFPEDAETAGLRRQAAAQAEAAGKRRLAQEQYASAQEAFGKKDYSGALKLLDEALKIVPDEARLVSLRAEVREARQAAMVETRRRQAARDAKDLLARDDFSGARDVLETAIGAVGASQELSSLLTRIGAQQAEHEKQERIRQAAVLETRRRQALHEVNDLLARDDLSGARAVLQTVVRDHGASQEVSSLLTQIGVQQAEHQKQERIRQVISQAQSRLSEEKYEEAIDLLQAARGETPASELDTLLATARDRQRAARLRFEETLRRAQDLLAAGQAAEAVALLEASPTTWRQIPEFQSLYVQCQDQLERVAFIGRVTADIEGHTEDADWASAWAALQAGLARYPDDQQLRAAGQRLQQEVQRFERRKLTNLLDEAKAALGRAEYRRATELLSRVDWKSGVDAELAAEAQSLADEVRRRQAELRPPAAGREVADRVQPGAAGRAVAVQAALEVPTPVVVPLGLAARLKQAPVAIWAGVAAGIALAVLVAALLLFRPAPQAPAGYVELTSAPDAEVTAVTTEKGQPVKYTTDRTPLRLALPPGTYVIKLKSVDGVEEEEKVEVKVNASARLHHPFRNAKDAAELVDDLLKKY